jgi:quercetin dioxygenase-like cupin family protein
VIDVTRCKVPEWTPPPMDGFVGIEGRVFLEEPGVGLAMLRFGRNASFPEHAGETDNWVVCVEGCGFVRLGGEVAEIRSGEKVFWPAGVSHQLYTEDSEMAVLMVHPDGF